MRNHLAVLGLLLTAALLPLAVAHPVGDGYLLMGTGTPPYFGFGPFFPAMPVGTFTIARVTADSLVWPVTGAGTCAPNIGQACFDIPAFNPNTFGPVVAIDCQIVSATGPWPSTPGFFLAQDMNGDGLLDNTFGPDIVVGPVGFAYGSPFGFYPAFWPAGAAGSAGVFPFGPGPLVAGVPVHIVAEHSFMPIGPWSASLTMTVTCDAI